MHMGMSRRNSVVSHVELCAGKGLCRDEFGVVIAACGQNQSTTCLHGKLWMADFSLAGEGGKRAL